MTATKTPFDNAPITSLVTATLLAVGTFFQVEFAWYWLFGAWLPGWLLVAWSALAWLVFLGSTTTTKPAKWNWITSGPSLAWFVLWLLPFAPPISWPLLRGPS